MHLALVYHPFLGVVDERPHTTRSVFYDVTPLTRTPDRRDPTAREREQDNRYQPRDTDVPEGQVVDTREAGEDRRPGDSRFLSRRDQEVEQQRQARIRSPGPRHPAPSTPQPPAPTVRGAPNDTQEQPGGEGRPMVAGLAVGEQGLPTGDRDEHGARGGPASSPPDRIALRPSFSTLSDAVGGPGLDDLEDIEDGEDNLLSTIQWRHAPFFERVKHQVEQYWRPDIAFRRHDPSGHVYGYRDRETVVRVVLTADGSLERAYVIRASGAPFLDDEAVRALEQASPFPNPPRGLVDSRTDRIVFTFGFTVILGEQPIFRLRRYR
jgi:TonB family protein